MGRASRFRRAASDGFGWFWAELLGGAGSSCRRGSARPARIDFNFWRLVGSWDRDNLRLAMAHGAHGSLISAERACIYIEERVRRASGQRWLQGPQLPALATPDGDVHPSVRLFAERRLHRVPSAASRALCAWARGERRVELLFHVPSPREVLDFQARGFRCVSLLADGVPTSPHEDGLAFVLHDLCHLEKFADPEHYEAQVGYFALVQRAMSDPRWTTLEAGLDPLWAADRDHVVADMNGSAVFLLLALKSKLKIAIRRRVARERGAACAALGPLDAEEQREWERALEMLFELLGLRGAVADSARALSEKGGAPGAEVEIHHYVVAAGKAALASADLQRTERLPGAI